MGEDDEKPKEDVVEVSEKVAELMEMGEEERVEYCKKVIKAVGKGLEEIGQIKSKIAQARAIKGYFKEIEEEMEEIRVAVLYTIKPEFRETYLELLEMFSKTNL